MTRLSSCRLAVLVGLLLCGAVVPVRAGEPAWLHPGARESRAAGGAPVWLVLAGPDAQKPFSGIEIRPVAEPTGKAGTLVDMHLDVDAKGRVFSFGWGDIRFIEFYTRPAFREQGQPVSLRYAPWILMADGEPLEEPVKDSSSRGILSPAGYTVETVRSETLHGKTLSERRTVGLDRFVLAVAPTREGARQARKSILQRAADNVVNRVTLRWGEAATVRMGDGPHTLRADWSAKTWITGGDLNDHGERTEGDFSLTDNGSVWSRAFRNRCRQSMRRSCGSQPRISVSETTTPPPGFAAVFARHDGMTLFYKPGSPISPALPSLFNVGVDYVTR